VQLDYNCRVPHLDQDSPVDYADRIASLVERRLPLPVESAGDEDDWSLVGPALLAAATRHLRTFGHLQAEFPPGVVAWQLLRTMFEYVTAFAWIAADPELRIRRWLKYDYGQRVKVDNDLRSLGDDSILDAASRGRLIAYEPDLDSMPGFVELAREADEAWAATLEQIDGHVPEDLRRFRLQYVWIYRNGSRFTHPSSHVVDAFVGGHPPDLAIGDEQPLERDLAVIATAVLGLGLTIAVSAGPAFQLRVEEIAEALS
jgi:hypothetical protein